MLERISAPENLPGEKDFDRTLRPKRLSDFVGQEHLKEILEISILATLQRGEPLDHILFYGPPGLGKTTLAHIIAQELGAEMKASSGPVLEKPSDLAGNLTSLSRGNVFFIDEIHRLNHVVEEYMYPAIEDFEMEINIDSGPNARTLKIDLEPFTLIGATTRAGLLTAPLRARFGITLRLDYYDIDSITRIITRSAGLMEIPIEEEGTNEIARRSRGTPRVANRLLRRVRDYAQVKGDGVISKAIAEKALKMLNVDELGLDDMDKRLLLIIINNYRGGPVGLKTLAAAIGEDPGTIEELYEPYLIQQGFLARTMQGRCTTWKAHNHFGISPQTEQASLFNEKDS
ncbi:MAG: Holliday junction branch migration DNA helicase RuvB [Candidatus Cloacimonetes bacterium]|nr:Holliday junction branch migration DNA helicase RuvB [Candidatus Cloacimonadota bacterium]